METVTIIISIWGAGLSTVLMLLRILAFRRDRPDIQVSIEWQLMRQKDETIEQHWVLKAVNKGRRRVKLERAGLRSSDGLGLETRKNWFAALDEQDSITVDFPASDIKETLSEKEPSVFIESAWFRDTAGKYYHHNIGREMTEFMLDSIYRLKAKPH